MEKVLVASLLLVCGCQSEPPPSPVITAKTVRANRLELVDDSGAVRAALCFAPEETDLGDGAGLVIYDHDGVTRGVFYVDSLNRSVLRMYDNTPSTDEVRFDAMVNENGPGSLVSELVRTDLLTAPGH